MQNGAVYYYCEPLRFGDHLLPQHNQVYLTDTGQSHLSLSLFAQPATGNSCSCEQRVGLQGSWATKVINTLKAGELATCRGFFTENELQLESGLSKDMLVVSGTLTGSCWSFCTPWIMQGEGAAQGTGTAGPCPRHRATGTSGLSAPPQCNNSIWNWHPRRKSTGSGRKWEHS